MHDASTRSSALWAVGCGLATAAAALAPSNALGEPIPAPQASSSAAAIAASPSAASASAAPIAPSAAPAEAASASAEPPAPPAPAPQGPQPPRPPTAPAPAEPAPVESEALSTARVILYVDHPETWLELRSLMQPGPWQRVCRAPCDQELEVASMEARVSGTGMTTSNTFRIQPGRGAARIRVDSGSSTARTLGIGGLIVGLPIAMTGMGLTGYGVVKEKAGWRTAGIITLAIGAATTFAALPLLVIGTTTVRDAEGSVIAATGFGPRM